MWTQKEKGREREREMAPSYCVKESKPCVGWVEKYFDDCLCNLKDDISFTLGIMSLICWGVAEIPQIITNFRAKSSHGVSLAFLLAWVVGNIFNLVGCLLEPATLPTQYYTALLYTTITMVLVLQGVYYDYICKWWMRRQKINNEEAYEEEKKPLRPSARELNDDSSYDDEPQISSTKPAISPRQIPPSVGSYGTFIAASMNLPLQSNALKEGYIRLNGRKLLLQEHVAHSVLGQWLGWLMASIYMGARLPQIWLNIKRKSVEGLNPLMFILTLIANATYVGSILVRTTEWESTEANMPWLLDGIVCVALDLFIILQYIHYRNLQRTAASDDGSNYGDYKEARLVS